MDVLDVGLDPKADLQLHGPKAFGDVPPGFLDACLHMVLTFTAVKAGRVGSHFGAECPAQQLVDRTVQVAADDVPKGDIDTAHGVDGGAPSEGTGPVVRLLPEDLDVEGVPADEHRLEAELDEGGGDLRWLQPVAQRLPPACDTLVGQDLHYHRASFIDPTL